MSQAVELEHELAIKQTVTDGVESFARPCRSDKED